MALSKTHTLITLIACLKLGKPELFQKMVPYVLLPDAIRCYGIPRTLTHFEVSTVSGKASSFKFPTKEELKAIDDVNVKTFFVNQEEHVQVAVGDSTSLATFAKVNATADKDIFNGCFLHLLQDSIYDEYIRDVIDMSKRLETEEFFFNGKTYDAKNVRTLISEIEEQEFQYLQKYLFELACIKADQEWFESTVKEELKKAYPEKMVDCTMKYISIKTEPAKQLIPESQVEKICNSMINACKPFIAGL